MKSSSPEAEEMKLLSKVFKSNYVQVGTPKPLDTAHQPSLKVKPGEMPAGGTTQLNNPEEMAQNIIEDAKQMYLRIIEEANSEAEKITRQANADAEQLLYATREAAYKEGFEAGFGEGYKEAGAIIEEAADIRTFIDQRKSVLYKEVEEDVISLVLEISGKVIGEELKQNKDLIFSLIRQALSKCAFKNKLILRVSQADFNHVSQNRDRISRMVEGISEIEVVADLSLNEGGCIIETPSGEINSGTETQMTELEKIFLYMLRNE